jgi:hypothetical protein
MSHRKASTTGSNNSGNNTHTHTHTHTKTTTQRIIDRTNINDGPNTNLLPETLSKHQPECRVLMMMVMMVY